MYREKRLCLQAVCPGVCVDVSLSSSLTLHVLSCQIINLKRKKAFTNMVYIKANVFNVAPKVEITVELKG